jgi:ATP-dependent DNA ligase
MKFPTLYKRTSTGAIEQWTVWVEAVVDGFDIVTEYGHVDGKLQQARETVREGKNLGKKNATTPKEQAESQAHAEHAHEAQPQGLRRGASRRRRPGENAGAGGIRPMLAKPFEDVEKKWSFPCYAQPKLDGIRCIAVVGADGDVTLWTREQKPILAVPRIAVFAQVRWACRRAPSSTASCTTTTSRTTSRRSSPASASSTPPATRSRR